ncbi:hypothetical protein OSCT_0526 [Oscillochloris trichoides DG-6]|uniref:Glycoside hydrolase family 42 N-terminal domain-containing protein n=1 Tax=Oscillochloris trichoides DG-6 TaxID=765420 RepID=E1IB25_9CHLR|nr:hypothetical protein OSCT_0526 [Oscillochloris trichoides DG-6]
MTYWPRPRAAGVAVLNSWGAYDLGAVREDLAHIAGLGCTWVHLDLRWAEVQPGQTRISTAVLHGLERGLEAVHAAGLQAHVGLMAGTLTGMLQMPSWMVGYRNPQEALQARRLPPPPLLLADQSYRHEPARDFYTDPDLRTATRYLLRECIGNFASHPAIQVWQLGAGLGRVRRANSHLAAGHWWSDLVEQARSLGAKRICGVLDGSDLMRTDSLRPAQIARSGAEVALAVAPSPPPHVARPWEIGYPTLLHAVVAALLRAEGDTTPIRIMDLGLATEVGGQAGWVSSHAYGHETYTFLADQERQAGFLEAALRALWLAGAGGVELAGYADLPASLWGAAPADRALPVRSWGLSSADGREKVAAAVVRRFAHAERGTPNGPPSMPVDPERYWRDPRAALLAIIADWIEAREA